MYGGGLESYVICHLCHKRYTTGVLDTASVQFRTPQEQQMTEDKEAVSSLQKCNLEGRTVDLHNNLEIFMAQNTDHAESTALSESIILKPRHD